MGRRPSSLTSRKEPRDHGNIHGVPSPPEQDNQRKSQGSNYGLNCDQSKDNCLRYPGVTGEISTENKKKTDTLPEKFKTHDHLDQVAACDQAEESDREECSCNSQDNQNLVNHHGGILPDCFRPSNR